MATDRWVTFDCYGTLIDWNRGMEAALRPVAGDRASALLTGFHRHQMALEGRAPHMPYTQVLVEALRLAAESEQLTWPSDRADALVHAWPDLPVYDDVPGVLRRLRDDGWRLGVLTNCDDELFARTAERLGCPLDEVVTAEQVGSYKPRLAHFDEFARRTGADATSWVHVANSWIHDMVPASRLDLARVWVDRDRTGLDPTLASTVMHGLSPLPGSIGGLLAGSRPAVADGVPLAMSSRERLGLGDQALRFLDRFITARRDAAASFAMPERGFLDDLRGPPPPHGIPFAQLLETIDAATRSGIDTAAGSHLSYIPNGGLYSAAVGQLLGAGINRYTGGGHGSPGAIALEQSVIDWMLGLFGLGPEAAGVLLSGGSLANLTAVVTARARFGDDFRNGTVYTSERAHHSVVKAARLAGIAADRVRRVATDDALRLDVDALEAAIAADLAADLRPMVIVGSAGTTDTGTVDPLRDLAAVAARHHAWNHVDAAYGGFFQLTQRGAQGLAGIELADSITVDAHKSLFMPYGVAGLLVRDGVALAAAHDARGGYMQDVVDVTDLPHYFALGPELTRPFRGLPVWLALHLHGVAAFRDELDRMLDLAARAQRELAGIPRVEMATEPDLSVVAFRSRQGDADSQLLFEHLNASRRVHVSSTTVGGRLTLRLAFLNHRTTDDHLDTVVELLRTAPRS